MATFKQVDPDEVDLARSRGRSRVSYPIVKGFLETGFYTAQVDLSDGTQKAPTMYLLLKSFVLNHDFPVLAILRRNVLYLQRLDFTKDGVAIPNWKEIRDAGIVGDINESGVVEIVAKDVVPETPAPKAKAK